MDTNFFIYIAPISAILALLYGGFLASWIMKQDPGNEKMKSIANHIQEGASAYLNRQYKTITLIGIPIAILIALFIDKITSLGFVIGAIFSAAAGYIGMNVSVRANSRTAQAASKGLQEALEVAFKGGAVTGLFVVGLGLLGVSGFYILISSMGVEGTQPMVGLAFGASLICLFARIGGGIYTKAADVGGDLVGKVVAGIPEDDPRNPAVIADNVGDNVGDCAGMAADLFETYVVTATASMLIGYLTFPNLVEGLAIPLAIGAVAIIASIIGTFFVKLGSSNNIMGALYKSLAVSGIAGTIGFYFISKLLYKSEMLEKGINSSMSLFLCSLIGIIVTALMVIITEYYTSTAFKPVREVSKQSEMGAATNIISGLAVGLKSTGYPIVVIVLAILSAYSLGNLYGVAIAAMSMLSMAGIIVALDSYGPITDNAGGIAEMSQLPPNIRKTTDALDAVGNTTKAVTKGYAIGSAALAALVLFADYGHKFISNNIPILNLSVDSPYVLVGIFVGGVVPFIFGAYCMESVGKAAYSIIEEVKNQFATKKILEGIDKPDYGKCVDIVTKAALKEMIIPSLLPVIVPMIVGLGVGLFNPKIAAEMLGGVLIGSIVTGLLLAIQMSTGGGTWDNAKKYIEEGHHGGKGSDAHKAAVVGDTVGDPFKDTAGPAFNPVIKVINIVALLIAPIIASWISIAH
ncbi:MAG: K(+)-insensitive pyrophosphate-energized proton pump [Candidatus Sericytochromatia bacterium]|nr:MAG: K(+)-insensitive pyrophosphate-energized proton pump [Candidatus Sericytochromatia bacterium]